MKRFLYLFAFLPSLLLADAKVSQLLETTTPNTTDYAYTVSNSTGMKVQWGNIINLPGSSTSYILATTSSTFLTISSAAATYLNIQKGGSNIFPSTGPTMVEFVSSTTFDQWVTMRSSGAVAGAFNAQGGFVSTANCFMATINNTSSANNARIQMTASGTLINRNVADANPNLIVNQINAASTGNILSLEFANVDKATFSIAGILTLPSVVTTTITTNTGLVLVSSNTAPRMVRIGVSGGSSAVVAGSTSCFSMNYEGNISSFTVEGDFVSTGSLTMDIKRASLGNFPGSLVSIIGSGNKPTLSSQSYATGTPASWTSTRLNFGDVVCGVNDSASTLTWGNVDLWVVP